VIVDEGELVLGESVVAAVRLGQDGISSGRFSVDFGEPQDRLLVASQVLRAS
jgi:hypothetical protein